jgi:hypothetical protein
MFYQFQANADAADKMQHTLVPHAVSVPLRFKV